MVQGLLVLADGAGYRRKVWKESVLKAGPAPPPILTPAEVPEPGGRLPLEEVAWSMKRPVAVPGQAGSAPH